MALRTLKGKKLEAEKARLAALRRYEEEYLAKGYAAICGIDEAGRGPLAGPVVAAAVILPPGAEILFLNDSKKLSEARREALFDEICAKAVSYGIGSVSPARIDEINILQATYEAMREAIGKLSPPPDFCLNDAVTIPGVAIPQLPIVKGDAKSLSIAAASVLAKVTRDRFLISLDALYPAYGFAKNKGYGTAAHIEALRVYGATPVHRKTFLTHFELGGEEA